MEGDSQESLEKGTVGKRSIPREVLLRLRELLINIYLAYKDLVVLNQVIFMFLLYLLIFYVLTTRPKYRSSAWERFLSKTMGSEFLKVDILHIKIPKHLGQKNLEHVHMWLERRLCSV